MDKLGNYILNSRKDRQTDDGALEKEIRREYMRVGRHNLWVGVKKAFVERCKGDEEWSLTRWGRLFYTAKCLLCVLLCRKWKHKYGDYPDDVEVSTIYERTLYAGWEAGWLKVGHGVFKGWFYHVTTDGDWWM